MSFSPRCWRGQDSQLWKLLTTTPIINFMIINNTIVRRVWVNIYSITQVSIRTQVVLSKVSHLVNDLLCVSFDGWVTNFLPSSIVPASIVSPSFPQEEGPHLGVLGVCWSSRYGRLAWTSCARLDNQLYEHLSFSADLSSTVVLCDSCLDNFRPSSTVRFCVACVAFLHLWIRN